MDKISVTPHYMVNSAVFGDLEAVKKIVESGVNPDDYTGNSMPAIIAAAMYDHTTVVEYLLSKGANPNNYTSDKLSALKSAARWKYFNSVKLLIQYGADANYERDGEVALTLVVDNATEKDVDLVKLLLSVTDKKYYQKAYEYASDEKIRKLIVEAAPTVKFDEPLNGYGGPRYKDNIRFHTPPTCKLLKQVWDLLTIYESFNSDPNDLFGIYMWKEDLAGSTKEVTYDQVKDWFREDRNREILSEMFRFVPEIKEECKSRFPEIYQIMSELDAEKRDD